MITLPTNYSVDYFYSASLLVGAVVNIVLSILLVAGLERKEFASVPAYRRSRYLTALSLIVFGIGFLLHWGFHPRAHSMIMASALSVGYFHLGGTLLALSHTSLSSKGYLTRRVVLRDMVTVFAALSCYVASVIASSTIVLYVGFAITLIHLCYLSINFYRHFHHTYLLLGNLAEFRHIDHQIDSSIRWMYFSCHLIIAFGLGGSAISAIKSNDVQDSSLMVLFILMMVCSVVVFSYIYFSLNYYGMVALQAQKDICDAYAFADTDDGKECLQAYKEELRRRHPLGRFSFMSGFYRHW